MSKIEFDSYNLKNKVNPTIDDIISSLKAAKSYLNDVTLPQDFYYRTTFYNTISGLQGVIDRLEKVQSKINKTSTDFSETKQEISSVLNKLPINIIK